MGLDMYLEGSFSTRAFVRPTDQDYADMREGKEVKIEKLVILPLGNKKQGYRPLPWKSKF